MYFVLKRRGKISNLSRRYMYTLSLTPDGQSPQVESRTRTCHKVCTPKDTSYWGAKRVTLSGQKSIHACQPIILATTGGKNGERDSRSVEI